MTNRRVAAVVFLLLATEALVWPLGCRTAAPPLQPIADATTPQVPTPPSHDTAFPPPDVRRRQTEYFRQNYSKHECRIPMRDGVRLFTAVFAPKDTFRTYPILLRRTPYSLNPYGENAYPEYPWYLGPCQRFAEEGYIFVYQDVRGRFMSEGEFVNVRPHIDVKTRPHDVDESSDTYDTIEWLLANVPNHNGRVGMWGISYPGFYCAAGMIDAHPALKAVSPQAPVADWFFDDFHHHGAFFLNDAFNFFAVVGPPREELTTDWGEDFDHGTPDGYQFFLDLGPVKNANGRFFHDRIAFWNEATAHPNYDAYWQARNLLPHLRHVAPAVMTVGGWFDAEDLYGPLNTYQAIEEKNPGIFNVLVMGPWFHGGWDRSYGDKLGDIHFGSRTADFYKENIELPFFNHFLKDQGELSLPEAYMFDTGAKCWQTFDEWPPPESQSVELHFHTGGTLSFEPSGATGAAYDEYVSDPAKPVPVTQEITTETPKGYMTADQRFAARRPDVLVYQTAPLDTDLTLAGPIVGELWVATSGTDSDWVVKLIDVLPADTQDEPDTAPGQHLSGYQMMVRSEVLRGRFRNSYEHPEPFVPDQPTRVAVKLQDVFHTFKAGHRIMVQIQSTWFPMVDRNPQTYVDNIFEAEAGDFVKAVQRVYCSRTHPTRLRVGTLASPELD